MEHDIANVKVMHTLCSHHEAIHTYSTYTHTIANKQCTYNTDHVYIR